MPRGLGWWRGTKLPWLHALGRVAGLEGLQDVWAGVQAAELPGFERS